MTTQPSVNVVFYNEQNASNAARYQQMQHSASAADNRLICSLADIAHMLAVVGHISYVWVVHIFFITFLCFVDDYRFLAAPVLGIVGYYAAYTGYYLDQPKKFIAAAICETLVGTFYLVFGLVLVTEPRVVFRNHQWFSRILYPASLENTMILGIYLLLSVFFNAGWVYVLARAYFRGYSLFYWLLPCGLDRKAFFVLLISSGIVSFVTIIALLVFKLVFD